MKILFLTRLSYPHIGGVERHVYEITKILKRKGNDVNIISEKEVKYPHTRFVGLIYIWYWFFKNRKVMENTDIVHCHDVFIWYLPFKFLYPNKKVYTTFHGWEGICPIPWKNIFLKRLASKLSNGGIAVGEYVERYYGIKTNKVVYGGISMIRIIDTKKKIKNSIVYIGRLEKDTGLLKFLKWLDKNSRYHIDFCGDGPLRSQCEKYGTVHGFCDPTPFLKKAEYCVPGGYLAALEGLAASCKLKLFWNNKVKEDYWKMSPFYKLKGKELIDWAKKQTWDKLANEYINLYHNI